MKDSKVVLITMIITVALGINAFFLKGIYTDLSYLRVELAKMIVKGDNKSEKIKTLEVNQKELAARISILERIIK